MDYRTRAVAASAGALCLFALVQLGAIALVTPFKEAGFQAVENPQDPTNSAVYLAFILVATGAMLLVIKYDVEWLLRGFLVATSAMISWYVFSVPAGAIAPSLGVPSLALSGSAALIVGAALYVHPEWYVIDAAGLIMGIGAAALFGISFGVLPALLFLSALAIYDAIAVYRTKHMLTLAEGVMDLRVPVVLVFPLRLDYSFLDDDGPQATEEGESEHEGEDDGRRDAFFIGLGDAVMPSIMVTSSAFFIEAPALVAGTALTLPSLGAMVGTLLGLTALLRMVFRGEAHAGLPLLNGGAIGGYLLGALAAGVPIVDALGLTPYV
ncbi:MAG: presenilin family intramembrane aspartyl protease PSH [Halobacteriaceae archaeon]